MEGKSLFPAERRVPARQTSNMIKAGLFTGALTLSVVSQADRVELLGGTKIAMCQNRCIGQAFWSERYSDAILCSSP